MLVSKSQPVKPGVRTEAHQMLYDWQVLKTLVLMAILYPYINVGDVKSLQANIRKDQGNLYLQHLLLAFIE